jgi:uncharacterized membrane protein YbhN (UPF0104 family)
MPRYEGRQPQGERSYPEEMLLIATSRNADTDPVTRTRGRRAATALVAAGLLVAIVAMLVHHGPQFADAVRRVSLTALLIAAGLHVVTIVARSEAWTVSLRAAGGRLERRSIYQVASLGFAANMLSTALGTAVRIWALRRKAADQVPSAPALVAAEAPIVALQLVVTAIMSASLIGPLDAPWWIAPTMLVVAIAVVALLARLAGRAEGPWQGLTALRSPRACLRILGGVVVISVCETARNLVLLRAVGLPASPLDAMALLVGAGVVGVLPIGPGSTAGAAMLIFGASGVGPAAAAGVLLTATGFAADVAYAGWGVGDMLWRTCPKRARHVPIAIDVAAALCCAGVALAAAT